MRKETRRRRDKMKEEEERGERGGRRGEDAPCDDVVGLRVPSLPVVSRHPVGGTHRKAERGQRQKDNEANRYRQTDRRGSIECVQIQNTSSRKDVQSCAALWRRIQRRER